MLHIIRSGDRANISNVAMLVTDGTSDWLYATEEARLLREKNSTILSVGVGPDTDWNLLVDISNSNLNVFEVANFATLQESPAIAMNRVLPKETTVYPEIIISPTLSGPRVDGHHFYFECSIQYVAETQNARYLITFLFDGLPGNAPTVELASPDTVAGLHDYFIRGQIGKNVSFSIRVPTDLENLERSGRTFLKGQIQFIGFQRDIFHKLSALWP